MTTNDAVRAADGSRIADTRDPPPIISVDGRCATGGGPHGRVGSRPADRFTVLICGRGGRGCSTERGRWHLRRAIDDPATLVAAAGGPVRQCKFSSDGLLAIETGTAGVPVDRKSPRRPWPIAGGKSPAWMRAGSSKVAHTIPGARPVSLPGQSHNVAAKALAPSWLTSSPNHRRRCGGRAKELLMTTINTPYNAAVGTARSTRRLLSCGTVAGPGFVVAALVQAVTRDGFDLKRHPFSLLSLGDLGYIQIANFVVCGALFIACSVGMRRVLRGRPAGTWGPPLVTLFGLGLIGGGVFVADPALGFPVGAGQGQPASISWHGTLHGVAFAVGIGSLVAAFFTFSRGFSAAGARRLSSGSIVTGAAFVILAATGTLVGDWRFVALAVVIGWTWLALVAAYYARSPRPD